MNSNPVGATPTGGGGGAEDYILIRDEKPDGTNGGTFTLGAWQTRDLNTEVSDTGGHASLSSNQITLAAGTYRVRAQAPGFKVGRHKIRLRNITDAVDIDIGSSENNSSSDNSQTPSFLESVFTIAAPKILELQHMSQVTASSFGFGLASNFGTIEVYAVIEFWKRA